MNKKEIEQGMKCCNEFLCSYKDKLIQDLYDLHVCADITIEELADDILDDIKHLNGRNYVELFSECPMRIDCPDGCQIDK